MTANSYSNSNSKIKSKSNSNSSSKRNMSSNSSSNNGKHSSSSSIRNQLRLEPAMRYHLRCCCRRRRDRSDELLDKWRKFSRFVLRFSFKKRCWAFLGHLLREIQEKKNV